MKTRYEIYSKEAAELLRAVSTYKTLSSKQIFSLFPGKSAKIQTIITQLTKQGRIYYNSEYDYLSAVEESGLSTDTGMIAAFWVLLDFIDKAEYHTIGEFPVKICFFADSEMYEIAYIQDGSEAVICQTLSLNRDPPRRLIIVENTNQIANIDVPNIAGFCTVAPDGTVSYYTRKAD
jgi:hypothetical protein